MNFKELADQRRSVNFFDPEKDVPEELLKEMVEIAAKTPSSFNLQPWSLMVIRDKAEKLRLQELAWNQPKVGEAPVMLIVLGDREGWKGGHPFWEKNFQEMVKAGSMKEEQRQWLADTCAGLYGGSEESRQAFACKNAGFFAMSLMFAAKSLGLDTHPMDGFDHEGVRKAFGIPENHWIPLLLCVGHFRADAEIAPPKWRKSFEDILVTF